MGALTRRQALTAVAAVAGGYVGAMTQGDRTARQKISIRDDGPMDLFFDLDSYRGFIFKQGGRTLTVTPKELMDALALPAWDE